MTEPIRSRRLGDATSTDPAAPWRSGFAEPDKQPSMREAAFRDREAYRGAPVGGYIQTRNAGPEFMRDPSAYDGSWDEIDQAIDQTFPASDPICYFAGKL